MRRRSRFIGPPCIHYMCVCVHVVVQMENVNVYKINNGVSREPRSDMVPEHQLERLTGEQAEVMVDKLVKPIKFRYTYGK